ncbi:MAG: Panacea domain-containing protein [Lachnospiraceae bacterium]
MKKILNCHEVAKWFIYHNPGLASGYLDENVKLNKLLYFSSLMYYCIEEKELLDEPFVAFPKGPVIRSIYRDYRYNGLDGMPTDDYIQEIDSKQKQILNIINFVYGDRNAAELINESHEHSLWKDVESHIPNNPLINFKNTENELKEFYYNLFQTYEEVDFSDIKKDKINGNIFYYSKSSFEMNDEIINALSQLGQLSSPQYIEIIDGELVLS